MRGLRVIKLFVNNLGVKVPFSNPLPIYFLLTDKIILLYGQKNPKNPELHFVFPLRTAVADASRFQISNH